MIEICLQQMLSINYFHNIVHVRDRVGTVGFNIGDGVVVLLYVACFEPRQYEL